MSYTVTRGPVIHDGKTYNEGQDIPGLTEREADALLKVRVIADTDKPKRAPANEGSK